MIEKICSICGGTNRVQPSPKWLTNYDGLWCYYCFLAWYDYDKIEVDQIKEASLQLQRETKIIL